ncbi:serine/threonine protein kinase, putative [Plasmodium ovale]|uniref:non-specific serine/threonine protein kinase n=1 Tax=Plasmodium ovale TaxID=36330 RepID=A0A1C3KH40_PLAOA|nr:serine/threonine protein kinase, putative [Plasmodium ovale]
MSYSDSRSFSNNSSSQDATSGKLQYTESDDEGSDEYCKGGYHPVQVNEIYNGRYRIEGKLGWGHFSTVWVATDLKSKPLKFVAIKIQKGSESYTESAKCEINYLKTIKINSFDSSWTELKEQQRERLFHYNMTKGVVSFIDSFEHKGPNGTHVCMVFEFMGPNLLSLIKHYDYKGIPLNLVRKIATHVLIGLQYLHDVCNIIHSDIKPENVLVSPLQNIPKPRGYTKNGGEKTDDNEKAKVGAKEVEKGIEKKENCFTASEVTQQPADLSSCKQKIKEEDTEEEDKNENDESNVNEVKERNDWECVDWSKLSKSEKKRLKKKKKRNMKKERLKMEAEQKDKQNEQPVQNCTPENENNYKKNSECINSNAVQNENNHLKREHTDDFLYLLEVNEGGEWFQKTVEYCNNEKCSSKVLSANLSGNISQTENSSKGIVTKRLNNDENDNKDDDDDEDGNSAPFTSGDRNNVAMNEKTEEIENEKNDCCDAGGKNLLGENQTSTTPCKKIYGHTEGKDEKKKKKKKKNINEPPYVKHKLKPSNSDPSLLTTYYNIHAIQETLMKKPYHYNSYYLNNPEKYGDKEVPIYVHRLPNDYLKKSTAEEDRDGSVESYSSDNPDDTENTSNNVKRKGEESGEALDKEMNKFPIYCDMYNHLIHPEAMRLYLLQKKKKKKQLSESPETALENNENTHKVVYIKTAEGDYRIRPYDPTVYYHEKSCYKICDLGNSLWINESRYAEIQTRQYRSPEVILKSGFDETADIWSFACMVFELVTGDFLFNPQKSDRYDKNEEHLSFIIEVLGSIPKYMIDSGYNSHKYFNKGTYKLKNIRNIKRYGLYKILKYKYNLPEKEIKPLCSFLLPMLSIDPQTRPSAYTMLQHPWLNMVELEEDEQMYSKNRSYSFNSMSAKNNIKNFSTYQNTGMGKASSKNQDMYTNFKDPHTKLVHRLKGHDEGRKDGQEEMEEKYQEGDELEEDEEEEEGEEEDYDECEYDYMYENEYNYINEENESPRLKYGYKDAQNKHYGHERNKNGEEEGFQNREGGSGYNSEDGDGDSGEEEGSHNDTKNNQLNMRNVSINTDEYIFNAETVPRTIGSDLYKNRFIKQIIPPYDIGNTRNNKMKSSVYSEVVLSKENENFNEYSDHLMEYNQHMRNYQHGRRKHVGEADEEEVHDDEADEEEVHDDEADEEEMDDDEADEEEMDDDEADEEEMDNDEADEEEMDNDETDEDEMGEDQMGKDEVGEDDTNEEETGEDEVGDGEVNYDEVDYDEQCEKGQHRCANDEDNSSHYEIESNVDECLQSHKNMYVQEDDTEMYFNGMRQKNSAKEGKNAIEMSKGGMNAFAKVEAKKRDEKENAKLKEQELMKRNAKSCDTENNKIAEAGEITISRKMGTRQMDKIEKPHEVEMQEKMEELEKIEKSDEVEEKNPVDSSTQEENPPERENKLYENEDGDKGNKINCKVINKKPFCAFS